MIQVTRFLLIAVSTAVLCSCNNVSEKGKFTVSGELKNTPDQHVYLEELYFSSRDPIILDTGEIKNGKFTVSALAPEEGLYRLRLEKNEASFIFINDQPDIPFSSDYNNLSLQTSFFNTSANLSLRKFMAAIDSQRKILEEKTTALQQYQVTSPASDSVYKVMQKDFSAIEKANQNYTLNFFDTTSDPIMAMFSLGYARDIEPEKLQKTMSALTRRFPGHQAIESMVAQYNQLIVQSNAKPHEGGQAPDINMPDTSGKPFALSMLRGKYVLVDFWASWCGPCRGENPNVVKAYNKFKNKNFTVLGVSLDKERAPWVKAIKDDSLAWHHISDLKYWNSAAVSLYGFEGIPYNVLVDPQGKIIGSDLRGTMLEMKLAEVIK